ncbi:MAG: helix-turn-helix domain-containing protein [Prochlorotrichaceae cyanobacterium]
MSPEQLQAIADLRARNLSPKQIARQLGLRPAEVSAVIRQQAIVLAAEQGLTLPPLKRCIVNELAVKILLEKQESRGLEGGQAQLFVLRLDRMQYFVTSYLIDWWCLGLKNCFGPRKIDRADFEFMVQKSGENMLQEMVDITLEEAQSIVYGAIDYSANIGFQPHPDFEQAQKYLEPRPETLIPMEFGHNGKPFYFQGPYDEPHKILRTLEKNLGKDEFTYVLADGPPGW